MFRDRHRVNNHDCLKNDYEYVVRTIVSWAGPFNQDLWCTI